MPALERLLRALSHIMGAVALVFLLVMMLATSVDVLVRAVLAKPLSGILELSELGMVMIVPMGLGWTQMDRAHIRVTGVVSFLQKKRPRAGRALDALTWIIAACVLVLLGLLAWVWPASSALCW